MLLHQPSALLPALQRAEPLPSLLGLCLFDRHERHHLLQQVTELYTSRQGMTPLFLRGEAALCSLLEEINQLSLLSPQPLLYLINLEEVERLGASWMEKMCEVLAERGSFHSLLFFGPLLPKVRALSALLEKRGVLLAAKRKAPWEEEKELLQWLAQEIQVRFSSPPFATLPRELLARVGDDKENLLGELEKLALYTNGGGKLTHEVFLRLCPPHAAHHLWELNQAVMARESRRALQLYREVTSQQGMALLLVLAALRSHFQQGLILLNLKRGEQREFYKKGHAHFPHLSERRMARLAEEAARYGETPLLHGLRRLFLTERLLKQGSRADLEDLLIALTL